MKKAINFVILTIMILMVSCATRVKTKYNEEINFRQYQTYAFMPRPEDKFEYLTNPERVNLKIDEKVTHALQLHLKRGGFLERTENPDFLVAYHTGLYDRVKIIDWGYSYARSATYWGGRDDIELRFYKEGTLVIDFVDVETKELIWRGAVKSIIEPGKSDESGVADRINGAVEKILAKFPPAK